MSTPIARRLAEWCAGVVWRDVPAAVQSQLPMRLLDTVGLILVGAQTEAGRAMLAQVHASVGAPESTLVGSSMRVPAAQAALAHGTLAHCRDFDDTFMDSVVHPGSVVMPTALALAETVQAETADFNAAVVAGYEVAARVGAVAGRRFHAHHLHATGIVGPIAAAATAGRLLQLRGEQIAWAMGLAASMSGGLMAFVVDGGWSKWLHAGWSAHGGVLAAQLAARGFRGPEHVLDGGSDLYAALLHGETIDRASILEGLGTTWFGTTAQFKYYPCAHVIQPFIDAILAIVREHKIAAADIQSIQCRIAPWAAAIVAEPRAAKLRFDTELEAIASLPYQLAVAVTERRVGLDALALDARRRSDYRALAERVTHVSDPSLGRGFDGQVTLATTAGERFELAATTAAPDPHKLREKFIGMLAPILASADDAAALASRLQSHDWRVAVDALDGGR